jgi:hypothetical protein
MSFNLTSKGESERHKTLLNTMKDIQSLMDIKGQNEIN